MLPARSKMPSSTPRKANSTRKSGYSRNGWRRGATLYASELVGCHLREAVECIALNQFLATR